MTTIENRLLNIEKVIGAKLLNGNGKKKNGNGNGDNKTLLIVIIVIESVGLLLTIFNLFLGK